MSNYPDNMSDYDQDPNSPEYTEPAGRYDKQFDIDWVLDHRDVNRDELRDREDDDDYNRDEPARF